LLISAFSATFSFGEIYVEGGLEAGAVVAGVRGYGVKAQGAGSVLVSLVFGLAGPFGAGMGIDLQGALPSDSTGDWRLRSFAGGRIESFLQLQGILSGVGDAGSLLASCRLGGSVALSLYPYTSLVTLWPSVILEPGLAFRSAWLDAVDFRISFPGALHIRSDVQYCFSAGIALTASFHSGGRWTH
jgi:hypothetical protein